MLQRFLFVGMLMAGLRVQGQDIRVLFNQSVDHGVSSLTDATSTSSVEDSIMAWIDAAQSTLDIAVWDNGSSRIVGRINAAHDRGVQVRYITSSNALNTALSGLNAAIPVWERNSGLTSNVMHNKFMVIDEQVVVSGSMNFGMGSMEDDYNQIVRIADADLAHTYKLEFDEMWGGIGSMPVPSNSKFGQAKTDNTAHSFTVNGTFVESYFSPTDNTTTKIIAAINSADHSLDIAMFTFIHNDIGSAVIAAHQRGVAVRCIIENVSYFGSEYLPLNNAGVPVLSHASLPFDFHHKYCIVDGFAPNSDPMVVTGSHNWTNSAEDEYDENTLIIHDATIAQQYEEEFVKRWVEAGGAVSRTEEKTLELKAWPNPSDGTLVLTGLNGKAADVKLTDLMGKRLTDLGRVQEGELLSLNVPAGLYLLEVLVGGRRQVVRVVVD